MANTYELIGSITVGAGGTSSLEFTSIPNTYTDLCLLFSARIDKVDVFDGLNIKVNNNTSNWSFRILNASSGTTFGSNGNDDRWSVVNGATSTANIFTSGLLYLYNYAGSAVKTITHDAAMEINSLTNDYQRVTSAMWNNSSAITSITIYDTGWNFVQYSTAYLYGIKNT